MESNDELLEQKQFAVGYLADFATSLQVLNFVDRISDELRRRKYMNCVEHRNMCVEWVSDLMLHGKKKFNNDVMRYIKKYLNFFYTPCGDGIFFFMSFPFNDWCCIYQSQCNVPSIVEIVHDMFDELILGMNYPRVLKYASTPSVGFNDVVDQHTGATVDLEIPEVVSFCRHVLVSYRKFDQGVFTMLEKEEQAWLVLESEESVDDGNRVTIFKFKLKREPHVVLHEMLYENKSNRQNLQNAKIFVEHMLADIMNVI